MQSVLTLDTQLSIEYMYSKQNIRKYVKNDISECESLVAKIAICEKEILHWIDKPHYQTKKDSLMMLLDTVDLKDLMYDILTVLLPYSNGSTMTAICGQCAHLLPYEDYMTSVKRMGELLVKMAECDLIDIIPARNADEGQIFIRNQYALDDKVVKYIEQTKFMPPLVHPPKHLKTNKDSGYYSHHAQVMSKSWNQHDGDICLDTMNLVNSIPFSLDIDLLKEIEDEMGDGETDNVKIREQQFNTLRESTFEVCLDLYHSGNRFWFTNYWCARGRLYCRGYQVSTQGNSYRKAMVNFADSENMSLEEEYKDFF